MHIAYLNLNSKSKKAKINLIPAPTTNIILIFGSISSNKYKKKKFFTNIIPEYLHKSQEFSSLILKEKKMLNNQADKMFQSLLSQLFVFAFGNDTVTSYGNFVFLDCYTDYIDLEDDVKKFLNLNRCDNIRYTSLEIINHLIDSNLVGKYSFLHYNDLLNDLVFQKVKNTEKL